MWLLDIFRTKCPPRACLVPASTFCHMTANSAHSNEAFDMQVGQRETN